MIMLLMTGVVTPLALEGEQNWVWKRKIARVRNLKK